MKNLFKSFYTILKDSKTVLLSLFFLALVSSSFSQTQIHQEDFEDAIGYSAIEYDDNSDHFFQRKGINDAEIDKISTPVAGAEGSFLWALANTATEQTLTIEDININNFVSLNIDFLIAAENAAEFEATDYLIIEVDFDNAGSYTTIGAFYGGATARVLREDDNLSGASDDDAPSFNIDETLTNKNFTISGTGGLLDIRVRALTNHNNEMIVFDNIRLNGTALLSPSSTTPADEAFVQPSFNTLVINYGENISIDATGTMTITDGAAKNHTWNVATAGPGNLADFTDNGNSISIDLSNTGITFVDAESYEVTMDAGIFKDASVNDVASISTTEWNFTIDGVAPTNQNTVFTSSVVQKGGSNVTIVSSGDATNDVWFAPTGTSSFSAGSTMTKATDGTATSILAPADEGTYYVYVVDQAGNISNESTATLTVDNTAPTNQNIVFPTSVEQQGGSAVTIVSSGDASNEVWFAPTGTTVFSAGTTMTKAASGTATSILAPADEGTYYIYVLDQADNISNKSTATLIVDDTDPAISSTAPTSNAFVNNTNVSYTITEDNTMGSGTITWTQTGGTSDPGTPHVQALTIGELSAGAHNDITLTSNPTLVDGAIYSIKFDVADQAGNSATTVTNTNVTYDVSPPTLSIGAPSQTDANNATTVDYVITYTGSSTVNLTAGDVNLINTGDASADVSIIGGTTATPTVRLTNASGNGTLRITINAGTSSDEAGNTDSGQTTSTTYNVDTDPPTLVIGAPSAGLANNAATVDYIITYTGATTVNLTAGDVNLINTGDASADIQIIDPATNTPKVRLTNATGNGTLRITIDAGTSSDDAGNADLGQTTSSTYTVDNSGPSSSASYTKSRIKNGVAQLITLDFGEPLTGTPTIELTGVSSQGPIVMTGGPNIWTYNAGSTWGTEGTVNITLAGATDAAGNGVEASPTNGSFEVDNTKPQANVTVNANPIFTGGLVQTVVITYNEEMDPTSTPAVTLSGTNWGGATGGSWGTTGAFSNDEYTVNFTHNGTAEEITSNVSVTASSGATDLASNADLADATLPSFTVDTQRPTMTQAAYTEIGGGGNDYVELFFSEPINLLNGASVDFVDDGGGVGLDLPNGDDTAVGSATYVLATNTVDIYSGTSNSKWDISTSDVTYTTGGNLTDMAGNEMANGETETLVNGNTTPPVLSPDVMTLYPDGENPDKIIFTLDEALNILDGQPVAGFSSSIGTLTGIYNTTGNTITLTSNSDFGNNYDWTTGVPPNSTVTISYDQVTGDALNLAGIELGTITNHAVVYESNAPGISVLTVSSNHSNPAWARGGHEVYVAFTVDDGVKYSSIVINNVRSGGDLITNPIVSLTPNTDVHSYTATFLIDANDTDGQFTFDLTFTDEAGYTVTGSPITIADITAGTTVTVDNTVPNTPSTPDMNDLDDSVSPFAHVGTVTDNITNVQTPRIEDGSTNPENNSTVNVYCSTHLNTFLGTGSADGSGDFSIATSSLAEGSHSIYIRAVDAAGNMSNASGGLSITIDVTPPQLDYIDLQTAHSFHDHLDVYVTEALDLQENSDQDAGFSVTDDEIFGTSEYKIGTGPVYYIHLGSANDAWSSSTLVSYNSGTGHMYDLAGNPVASFSNIPPTDAAPPAIGSGLVFLPNGTSPEQIVFVMSEELNNAAGSVDGFRVNGETIGGFGVGTAIYSDKGVSNTITLTSPSNNYWDENAQVSYLQGSGNVEDLVFQPMENANEEILIQNLTIRSNNDTNPTTHARQGDKVFIEFSVNPLYTLSATPVVTIDGDAASVSVESTIYDYIFEITTDANTTEAALSFTLDVQEAGDKYTSTTATTNDSQIVFDKTAPTSQNTVFAADIEYKGGNNLTIGSSGDINNTVWLAPASTTSFTANGTTITQAATGTSTIITTPTTEGDYKAYVVDQAGNISNESTATLTVDNTSPTVVISSDDADGVVKDVDAVTITATLTETNTIDETPVPTITIGSIVVNQPMSKTNNLVWTYNWDVPAGNDGNYAVTINAPDEAGNATGTHTGETSFTIDNTAPTLTITKNNVTSGTNGAVGLPSFTNDNSVAYTITFDAPLNASTFTIADITVNQSSKSAATFDALSGGDLVNSGDDQTFTLTIPNTAGDGDLYITIGNNIDDIAGNTRTEGPSDSDVFIIDNTAPVITADEISMNSGASPDYVFLPISEDLGIGDGSPVVGLSTTPIDINPASGTYFNQSTFNFIRINGINDGEITINSLVNFTNPGNITDKAGNPLTDFSGQSIEEDLAVPTTLTAGDIMFSGYNAEQVTTDGFSFVLLKDIPSGTKIKFTDRGWSNTSGFTDYHNNLVNESVLTWTSSSEIFAGSEISVDASNATASTGNVSGTLQLSATYGDQILAYQGPEVVPIFLTAIHMDYDAGNYNATTGWSLNTGDTFIDDERSELSSGLIGNFGAPVNNNSLSFGDQLGTATDAQYNGTDPATSVAALRTSMADPANWNKGTSNYTLNSGENYTLYPDLDAVLPIHGADVNNAGLSVANGIKITFNNNITSKETDITTWGTRNINIVKQGTGTVLTYGINDAKIIVNIDGTVTLNIAADIIAQGDGIYEIHVDPFMFVNSEGLHNTGIDGNAVWTFTFDGTLPQISSITRTDTNPHDAGVNAGSVDFTVVFNENVNNVDIADFTFSTSNIVGTPTVSNVDVSTGTSFIVTVNGFDLDDATALGTLNLDLSGAVSILDDAGNNTDGIILGVEETYDIINPEPAEDIAALNGTAQTTTIDLNWTNSGTNQIAYQHLILLKAASVGSFPAVADGTPVPDDNDLGDNILVFNVGHGVGILNIAGLNSATDYNMIIYPYTNSGGNIDYQTNAPATRDLSTQTASETSITFTSATTSISSLSIDEPTKTASLVFTVIDDDGNAPADNVPTLIQEVVFTQGAGNSAEYLGAWDQIIDQAELTDGTASVTVTPSNNALTFTLPHASSGDLGYVDDNDDGITSNGIKVYTLNVWLKTDTDLSGLITYVDGSALEFEFDISNQTVDNANGSGILPAFTSITSGNGNNIVDVNATEFEFVNTPDPYEGKNIPLVNAETADYLQIRAQDVHRNLDIHYTTVPSFDTPGAGTNASAINAGHWSNGILDYSLLQYSTTGDGELTINATSMISDTSTPIDVVHTTVDDTNISGITPAGSLNAPSPDHVLIGANYVAGYNAVAPELNRLDFAFYDYPNYPVKDDSVAVNVSQVFDNFRLVYNQPNFNPNSIITISGGSSFAFKANDGVDGSVVSFQNLTEEITSAAANQNIYLMANVRADASTSAKIGAVLLIDSVGLDFGSADDINPDPTSNLTGNVFEFIDKTAPELLILNENQSIPKKFAISFDGLEYKIQFNEKVLYTFDDTGLADEFRIKVHEYENPNSYFYLKVDNVSGKNIEDINNPGQFLPSTSFYFIPEDPLLGDIKPETWYYISIPEAQITNNPIPAFGFIDTAPAKNRYLGIPTDSKVWAFKGLDEQDPLWYMETEFDIAGRDNENVWFDIQLNETGYVYYAVVDGGTSALPSEFVLQELDGSYSKNQTFANTGNNKVDSVFISKRFATQRIYVSGLTKNSSYSLTVVASDISNNLQAEIDVSTTLDEAIDDDYDLDELDRNGYLTSSFNTTNTNADPAYVIPTSLDMCYGESQPIPIPITISEGIANRWSETQSSQKVYLSIQAPNADVIFDQNYQPVFKYLNDPAQEPIPLNTITTSYPNNTLLEITFDLANVNTGEVDYLQIDNIFFKVVNPEPNPLFNYELKFLYEHPDNSNGYNVNDYFPNEVYATINPYSLQTKLGNKLAFEIDPFRNSTGDTQGEKIALHPKPDLNFGTNVFSGAGVYFNSDTTDLWMFDAFTAGIGTKTITLTHTDENSCSGISKQEITVFDWDKSITDLDNFYCLPHGTEPILINSASLVDYTLDTLYVSIDSVSLIDAVSGSLPAYIGEGVLVKDDSDFLGNYLFNPDSAAYLIQHYLDSTLVNGKPPVYTVALQFIGEYTFNANTDSRLELKKVVNLSLSPEVSLIIDQLNLGDLGTDDDYCEDHQPVRLIGDVYGSKFANDIDTLSIYSLNDIIHKSVIDGATQNLNQTGLSDEGGGEGIFDPVVLASNDGVGDYEFVYYYKNSNTTCAADTTLSVYINPLPVANFAIDTKDGLYGCLDEELTFINTTDSVYLNPHENVNVLSLSTFQWNFDDANQIATTRDAAHDYPNSRTYDVNLFVETVKGCIDDVTQSVNIGGIPEAVFTYDGVNRSQTFNFNTQTALNSGLTADEDYLAEFSWNFGDGSPNVTINGDPTGINRDETYIYSDVIPIGEVSITAVTNLGCDDSFTKPIIVLDTLTAFPTGRKISDNLWVPYSFDGSSSWGDGKQAANDINADSPWWITRNSSGFYNEDEKSFVHSPTYDVSRLVRPLIEFNAFWELSGGEDGAVLQYSLDNKNVTDLTKNWIVVGDVNSGISWYNDNAIGSNPGSQATTLLGWSGSNAEADPENTLNHSVAKHSLNELLDQTSVTFRIAFSADGQGSTRGFAFNNVRIGERTRTVLLENFANTTNSELNAATEYITGTDPSDFEAQVKEGVEVVTINYHTDFPDPDVFNMLNPVAPSARAAFYNINELPATVLDGRTLFPSDDRDPFHVNNAGLSAFQKQSLQLADYELSATVVQSDPKDNVSITVSLDQSETDPVVNNGLLYIALVERSATVEGETSKYVLRQMLPSAAGTFIPKSEMDRPNEVVVNWTPGSASASTGETTDFDNMDVIVFLQDETTKAIYQSIVVPLVNEDINLVTDKDDQFNSAAFSIFPNPAKHYAQLEFGRIIEEDYKVKVFDQFGKLMFSDYIPKGARSYELDTRNYLNSLYIVQVESDNELIERTKLIILNK